MHPQKLQLSLLPRRTLLHTQHLLLDSENGYKSSSLCPQDFTGHSFRRGAATYLYRCGGSILQIKSSGDWATDTFTRYLNLSIEERQEAQALIAAAISSTLDF